MTDRTYTRAELDAAVAAAYEKAAALADAPLAHRKGKPGLWRQRRAAIAAEIRALINDDHRAALEAVYAERDEVLNQLDSARHSVCVLENKLEAVRQEERERCAKLLESMASRRFTKDMREILQLAAKTIRKGDIHE